MEINNNYFIKLIPYFIFAYIIGIIVGLLTDYIIYIYEFNDTIHNIQNINEYFLIFFKLYIENIREYWKIYLIALIFYTIFTIFVYIYYINKIIK